MREVMCRAGERTRVLHLFSDSVPQSVRFTACSLEGDGTVSGTVEIVRSVLPVGGRVAAVPLAPENAFRKSMFDTRYSVYVTPSTDTRIVFRTRHFSANMFWLALGGVLIAGLAGGIVAYVAG